ncbi:MAG: NAD(P)H-hydrate epimerase, partial [Pseudomonadota bacterium]
MTEFLTAAQMRAIEQAAIDSGEVTGLELMERAGRGVVEAIFEEWPELAETSHRAVVLCGPGNNGGDGFVVARLLREWGWEVEVFLYGDPDKLPPDARVNYERWGEMGEVKPIEALRFDPADPENLTIDALFGTGLTRPIQDPWLWEVLWSIDDASLEVDTSNHGKGVAGSAPRTLAIDIPSGLCADSGMVLGGWPAHGRRAAMHHLTVSFHRAKAGHYLCDGPLCSGKVLVKDIGIEGSPRPPGGGLAPARGGGRGLPGVPPRETAVRLVKSPPPCSIEKWLDTHKYTHGHAFILSGGPGKGGAARLAARGALRIGAGLVTVGCPPDALTETAARLDAIMCQPVADAVALGRVLDDGRLNALCLGPGLGVGEQTRTLVATALVNASETEPDQRAGRGVVLDADALTSFGDEPQALFDQLH